MNAHINIMTITEAFLKEGTRDKDATFFMARYRKYPYTAQAPSSVRPTIVPGNHMSVRLRTGWRAWAFETETERDTFILQFGGRAFP